MFTALNYYVKALPFLFKHKLGHFLLYPFIIMVLVIWGGASLASFFSDSLTEQMHIWFDNYSWLPDWAAWLEDIIYWLVWIIFRIVLYFAMAFLGGSIILLLMSPILTLLSERIAQSLKKSTPSFTLRGFIHDLYRAAVLTIKNGAIQFGLSLICLLIGFIPAIGLASPFLLIIINAYFFGFNFIDYSLERHQMSVSESNRFIFKHKLKATGIGVPFSAWLLIPFIGPITSGFAAVIATVAATLWIEELGLKRRRKVKS